MNRRQFQGSYTWSKSIDSATAVFNGPGTNSVVIQNNPFCWSCEKLVSGFDFLQCFVVNFIYELPADRWQALSPVPRRLTQGWQITGIHQLQSGFSFTVNSPFGTVASGTDVYAGRGNVRPDLVPQPTLKSGPGPAADVVLTDQHQLGSLSRFRHVAWILAIVGIPIVKHSFGDLGFSSAAGMHVIASSPNFTKANQTHFGVLTDDIVEGGLAKFRNGCLTLPEGPGLGVKLDRKSLEKYAKYFEEKGELPGYGSSDDRVKSEAQQRGQE